jgi:hypothetical protein
VGATLLLVGLLGFIVDSGSTRGAASTLAALSLGDIYGVVTIIGLIDGEDVLGLFPVNPADNVLHILLTIAAFAAAFAPLRDRKTAHSPRTA